MPFTADQFSYFLYNNGQILLQLDSTGDVDQRLLWGSAVDQILADENGSGDVYWMLTDHQNTVRDVVEYDALADTTTVVNHIAYNAFGEITSETNSSLDTLDLYYTARYTDAATGLQYNTNRWYNAELGRWMSQDPIGFNAGDENLYRYVGNGHLNGVDPSGLHPPQKSFIDGDGQGYYGPPNITYPYTMPFHHSPYMPPYNGSVAGDFWGQTPPSATVTVFEDGHIEVEGEIIVINGGRGMRWSPLPNFGELALKNWKLTGDPKYIEEYKKLDPDGHWIDNCEFSEREPEEATRRLGMALLPGAIAASTFGPIPPKPRSSCPSPSSSASGTNAPSKGSLTNTEVRKWYDPRAKSININRPPTEANARAVHAERNALKQQARDFMSDRAAAARLDKNQPIRDFDYYAKKYSEQGYEGEALWRRIMEGGKTPNAGVSKQFGID